jgi:hypothetical protein
MNCTVCGNEAIGKCVGCGAPLCRDHGPEYCPACAVGVFSREAAPTVGHGKGYLQSPEKPRMETIYIDDDGPPSCYLCQALARKICQNCHQLVCKEHVVKGDWCDQCARSARLGTWLTLGILGGVTALAVLFFVLSKVTGGP